MAKKSSDLEKGPWFPCSAYGKPLAEWGLNTSRGQF